jgi:hypothetical protein
VRRTVTSISRRCNSCSSNDLREFKGEFAIHFAGIEGLSKAIVWVFPEVSVCLTCGMAQFHVPDRELSVLGTGISVEGAAVLFEKSAKQHGVGAGVEDEAAGSKRPES